jgi:hypothetical protein
MVWPQRGHSSGSTAQVLNTRAAQRVRLVFAGFGVSADVVSSTSGVRFPSALAKCPALCDHGRESLIP